MLSLLSTLLLASGSSAAPALKKRADTCNGSPELCGRSYGQVTYIGAHDSFTNSDFLPSANQEMSVPDMLDAGVRLLQAQGHAEGDSPSGIRLCHTNCILYDGGSLEDYLSTVKGWMDANPNEVVTILFVNSDGKAPSDWAKAYDSSGLTDLSYTPPSGDPIQSGSWPTLGEMIDSGKRLVTFIDSKADFGSVGYIIDEFNNIFETPYDVTDADALHACPVDRVTGDAGGHMGLINHFKDKEILPSVLVPDKGALETTNSADDILQQANTCKNEQGQYPTFVLLDFVDHGNPYDAARTMNGL